MLCGGNKKTAIHSFLFVCHNLYMKTMVERLSFF